MYLIFSQRKKIQNFHHWVVSRKSLIFLARVLFSHVRPIFMLYNKIIKQKWKYFRSDFRPKNGKKLFYWRTQSPIIQIGPSKISPLENISKFQFTKRIFLQKINLRKRWYPKKNQFYVHLFSILLLIEMLLEA